MKGFPASNPISEPPPASTSSGSIAMDAFDDEPAAAAPPATTNGDAFETDAVVVSDESPSGGDPDPVVLGASDSLEGLNLGRGAPSPSVPREEPETIKKWRAEQEQRLAEKDAREEEMMKELKEKAKQELQDWLGGNKNCLPKFAVKT